MRENICGQRFGKLVAIKSIDSAKRNTWLCQCDCGNTKEILVSSLKIGTKSCGCIHLERVKESKSKAKQRAKSIGGDTKICEMSEYNCWISMRRRCNDKNSVDYHNYGGRGIKVCESWNSFENFVNDVGHRPSKDFSLDRIDVNGNYEPENVKWSSIKDQAKNKRSTVFIEYNGEKHCLEEWARIRNRSISTISKRYKEGWSPERILNTPSKTGYVPPQERANYSEKTRRSIFYTRKKRSNLNRPQDDFTFEQWEEILASSKGKCFYCHNEEKLSIDHVLSIKKGGFDTKDNIVAACRSCNSSKRDGSFPRNLKT